MRAKSTSAGVSASAPTIIWLNPANATITKTNGVTGTVTFANDQWTVPFVGMDTGAALLYGTAPDRFVFALTDLLGSAVRPGTQWPMIRVVVDEVTRPVDGDCEVTVTCGVADSSNTRKLLAGLKYDGNIGLCGLNASAIGTGGGDGSIKHVEGAISFFGKGRWGSVVIEGYNAAGTTLVNGPITRAGDYEPTASEDLVLVVEFGHRISKPTRAAGTGVYRFGVYLEYTPTSASRIHA